VSLGRSHKLGKLVAMSIEEVKVDRKHYVPHRGTSGEEATIEPKVEPDHVERDWQSEECPYYLAASPEGIDSEEVYHRPSCREI
jgi:hypothetical protein